MCVCVCVCGFTNHSRPERRTHARPPSPKRGVSCVGWRFTRVCVRTTTVARRTQARCSRKAAAGCIHLPPTGAVCLSVCLPVPLGRAGAGLDGYRHVRTHTHTRTLSSLSLVARHEAGSRQAASCALRMGTLSPRSGWWLGLTGLAGLGWLPTGRSRGDAQAARARSNIGRTRTSTRRSPSSHHQHSLSVREARHVELGKPWAARESKREHALPLSDFWALATISFL